MFFFGLILLAMGMPGLVTAIRKKDSSLFPYSEVVTFDDYIRKKQVSHPLIVSLCSVVTGIVLMTQ
jgi:hypothetical protein